VPQASLTAAAAANNAFAVDLYAHVVAGATAHNVMTSPVSASLALTMAYAGAAGQTASEMAGALHLDTAGGATPFDGQSALSEALAGRAAEALAAAQQSGLGSTAPGDYVLDVVNSVWGQKDYPWAAPFLSVLARDYGAGVMLQDFAAAPAPAEQVINGWVSGATHDRINDLLPPGALTTTTRMVLVDAIHLKLPWATPFQAADTQSLTFHRADGTTVAQPFMQQSAALPYADDGMAQIVALPLSNHQLSVVIALPHAGVSLATYEASLTAQSPALSVPASTQTVGLAVPKTTFTTPSLSLAAGLKSMGMVEAFDPAAANFQGMCATPPDGGNLYVSDVLQKAMFSMGENGVEAAAATAVDIALAAAGVGGVPMTIDRPYLVSIVDAPTGAVVFLGHVSDPSVSQ
jgi:serpin B